MAARWWVALVVVGCSRPTPARELARPDPVPEDAGAVVAPTDPIGDGSTTTRADEAHARPVDGKVIETHVDGGELRFTVGLPPSVKPGDITVAWTGIFLRDGTPIRGTEFKLLAIQPREVRARIAGQQLPSRSVRLYEPYYPDNLKR